MTSNGQTVWSYVNPVTHDVLAQGSVIPNDPNNTAQHLNEVFKVHRYQASYSGLACKDLTPRGMIETYAGAATDTTGLGLPDMWIRSHFGSLSVVTTNSSPPGNGLTDIQEYKYGLDPTHWSSCSNGIPDGWAIAYGFDPTLAGLAALTNLNGFTTLDSYVADLNPTNASSRLAITGILASPGAVNVSWIGGTGAWQVLEYAPTLASKQWSAIFTNTPPTTTVTNSVIHIGDAPTNFFFRINAHR